MGFQGVFQKASVSFQCCSYGFQKCYRGISEDLGELQKNQKPSTGLQAVSEEFQRQRFKGVSGGSGVYRGIAENFRTFRERYGLIWFQGVPEDFRVVSGMLKGSQRVARAFQKFLGISRAKVEGSIDITDDFKWFHESSRGFHGISIELQSALCATQRISGSLQGTSEAFQ